MGTWRARSGSSKDLPSLQMLTENARAREEAERRIAAQNRRMDHLERARREEEAPLLEKAFQQKVLSFCQHESPMHGPLHCVQQRAEGGTPL